VTKAPRTTRGTPIPKGDKLVTTTVTTTTSTKTGKRTTATRSSSKLVKIKPVKHLSAKALASRTAKQRHTVAAKLAAAKKAGKVPKSATTLRKPRKLSRSSIDGSWILGDNDVNDSCVAVAIANSHWLSTGIRPTEGEVLTLCQIVNSMSISDGLEVLADLGLGGVRPKDFYLVEADLLPGLILGIGQHTVAADFDGVITWGHKVPVTRKLYIEEAWLIEWPKEIS
jgi:hypothetical protein